jgi:hypothetical protein
MVRKAATPVWVRLLSVNNRWFGDQLFSCKDENRADPWLPSAFLSFSVYIFFGLCLFFFGFLLCFGLMFPFLTLYFFWVVFCLLCFSGLISLPGARFSAPFYRDPQLAPNQSCLCRTVSSTNEIVGKGRGPRLDLLQIFRSPVESGWRRSHGSPTSNGDVSAKRHIFTLTPELWKFGNWTPEQLKISFNFAPFWLISIKSLNYNTVYKTVLNFQIVQFSP